MVLGMARAHRAWLLVPKLCARAPPGILISAQCLAVSPDTARRGQVPGSLREEAEGPDGAGLGQGVLGQSCRLWAPGPGVGALSSWGHWLCGGRV